MSATFSDRNQQVRIDTGGIVAGTLPQLASWVSGTAQQNPTARTIVVVVAITGDATNNVATCAVAVSPDNVTFTTVATSSLAAAVNNTGAIATPMSITLPAGWWVKLTLTHTTVAQSSYY